MVPQPFSFSFAFKSRYGNIAILELSLNGEGNAAIQSAGVLLAGGGGWGGKDGDNLLA
jgi:hypothetical protein